MEDSTRVAPVGITNTRDNIDVINWVLENGDAVAENGKSVADTFFASLASAIADGADDAEVARKARQHVAANAFKVACYKVQVSASKMESARDLKTIAGLFTCCESAIEAFNDFKAAEKNLVAVVEAEAAKLAG